MLYFSGRLPPADAEAYEEHLFSCAECAAAAERASEIRDALDAVTPPSAYPRPLWRRAGVAAAAAAVVVIAMSLVLALPRSQAPRTPATRGQTLGLSLEARSVDGKVALAWPARAGADRYLVRLFAADGEPLFSRELTTLRLTVPLANLPAGAPLFARVEALSPLGEVLADSGLVSLPGTDAPPP